MFGNQPAAQKSLADLGFPASTRLLLLMRPFNLQAWARAEDTLNIYLHLFASFANIIYIYIYMGGTMSHNDVTVNLHNYICISNACSLSTPHSHWPRFLRLERLHLQSGSLFKHGQGRSAGNGWRQTPEIITLKKAQPKWHKNYNKPSALLPKARCS